MSVISNHSNKFNNKIGIISTDATSSNEIDYIVGDKVFIASNPDKTGIVAYNGTTRFSDGIWIGVALNQPLGKHNGVVQGITYFQCEDKHGIFVRKNNLRHACQLSAVATERVELNSQQINNSNLLKQSSADSDTFIVPNLDLQTKSNLSLGDKVCVIGKSSNSSQKVGTLRFIGGTKFADGVWAGIELDNPIGRNDGSVDGFRYFSCKPQYGLFALENKVQKYSQQSTGRNLRSASRIDSHSKYGSNESISSIASNFSSASRTRVRLGMTAINANGRTKTDKSVDSGTNKLKNVNSMGVVKETKEIGQGSNAFQKVLKEKEQHVEQLIREREIERIDLASATGKIEELERQLGRQICANNEQNIHFEQKILEFQETINFLNQEKEKLLEKLDEEKKKTEDLLFQIEEKNIDESDLENKTEESEHQIFELNEKLAHERDLREALEKRLTEVSANNIKNTNQTEVEVLKSQLVTLEKELSDKRDSKISSMLKVIEEKDAVINDIQDRYDGIKLKLEQILRQNKSTSTEISQLKALLNEESLKTSKLKEEKEKFEIDISDLKNLVNKQNEKLLELSLREKQHELDHQVTQAKEQSLKSATDASLTGNDAQTDKENVDKNITEKLREDYENKIMNLKLEIEKYKKKNSYLDSLCKSSNHELVEKNSEIADLIQKLNHTEQNLETQIKLKQSALNEKDNICKELSINHEQLERLRSQISDILSEKHQYSEEINKAKQTEINLKQELIELKSRIEFLEKENQILKNSLYTSENKQSDIINSAMEKEQKVTNLEREIQKLNVSLKSEKDSNMLLITKNATLHSDLEQMRQKIDDFKNLSNDNEVLQSLNAQLENDKISINEKYETKNKELMIVRERLLKISQEYEDLQESHKNICSKFERDKRLLNDKIRKLEKHLDEPDKKSQFSQSDSCNDKRKSDGKESISLLKASKDNAEEQIRFLNLVIAEREKKFRLIETENENLKNKIKDFENGNVRLITTPKKIVPPRLYCDVCEVFDAHDTDECPVVSNSSPQSSPLMKIRQPKERVVAPRLYCDICEIFDAHNTSDCQDEQTY